MILRYLILLSLLFTLKGFSIVPQPHCTSPSINSLSIPISLNQIQSFNLNNFFSGYNLQFNTSSTAPSFLSIFSKFVRSSHTDLPQLGLKNYHLQHLGNEWGQTLVTLAQKDNITYVRWGKSPIKGTIPQLTEKVTVESEQNITCFDAVWFEIQQVILVDCSHQSADGFQNQFIYINSTTQTKLPNLVKNDIYVKFSVIPHRKLYLLHENDYSYLMRAYFSNKDDKIHANNTYLQILSVVNPLKPWTMKVMDRSFLSQDQLAITDFQVYLGDMYILDFHSGVIRFDITSSQNVVITGRYRTNSGFRKMGVFSNDLYNQFLLVLANEHAVYEIDWTNQITPAIIAKYSLMENALINSLWVNQMYVVVQVTANLTDQDNNTVQYNSTYIFGRGTRTYTNAYVAIQHKSPNVRVDFNREDSYILSMDQSSVDVYLINEPILQLYPVDPNILHHSYQFIVSATSSNEYTSASRLCSFEMQFMVVNNDTFSLFPTGYKLPDSYYANYPGQLFLSLNRYILGANITWDVNTSSQEKPEHWILQQNSTNIFWDTPVPSLGKITLLRQEQYDSQSQTDLFIYTQNVFNETHFVKCHTVPYTSSIFCDDDSHIPHINITIRHLTANKFHYYSGQYLHLAAIVYNDHPNQVIIYEVDTKILFTAPLIMGQGYDGQIQSIEFLGQFLVVVLRYTKEIVFYDMIQCMDHQSKQCQRLYVLDSIKMDEIGVQYFAPVKVYTSDYHPSVLFIQNLDSVIIIQFTRIGPKKLSIIEITNTKPGFAKWKLAIALGHLLIIQPPNYIQEYSLQDLYSKKGVFPTKLLPIYNYTIPEDFDCDFSDNGDLVYITGRDPQLPETEDTVILVYRAGFPAVSAFYDVFHLNAKYSDVLIDATGTFGDYVAITMGSILQIFRQYQIPILVFRDSYADFNFTLQYSNNPKYQRKYFQNSAVKIANYPEKIVKNDSRLDNKNFLKDQINYQQDHHEYNIDDFGWFNGSVVNYSIQDCPDCGPNLRIQNHLQQKADILGEMDMDDYVFTSDGGVIQQLQSLLVMNHNGSISKYVGLPAVLDGENCRHIQHSWVYSYTISACINYATYEQQVYLYTTTYTSSKPFVSGPFYSSAKDVASIHIIQDIMIVVDVDETFSSLSRQGGVIIYSINHDPYQPEIFDELEFIDTQDLLSANNWPNELTSAYIGNAEISYSNQTDVYRIIITELQRGLFFVDFKWTKGRSSVQIIKIQFVDLQQKLVQVHMPLPNSAFFEAVTTTQLYYDNTFKYFYLQLIVTTRNFHILQLNVHLAVGGSIVSADIGKIYYRYGFYEVSNYIKSFDGYFVVAQKVPLLYQNTQYSQQVLTIYDTRQRWVFSNGQKKKAQKLAQNGIPITWMLGGIPYPKGRVTFDFNFTFIRNSSDPLRHIGLILLHSRRAVIKQVTIHDKIRIVTEKGLIGSDNAKLRANNDFSNYDISLSIVIEEVNNFPGWAIALVVICSILLSVIVGIIAYRYFLQKRFGGVVRVSKSQNEKSLLEKEAQYQDDVNDSEEDVEDEEDEENEEDKQEQKINLPPPATTSQSQLKEQEKAVQKVKQPMSINRQTVSDLPDDEELKPQIPQKVEEQAKNEGQENQRADNQLPLVEEENQDQQ